MSLIDFDTMNSHETKMAITVAPADQAANEPSDELRLLEALLFAAPSPVDEEAIKQRLPEGVDIPALIDEITAFYAPRGVNIVRVAGGWTIRTAPDLAPRLKLTQKVGRKLSRAAIETLAIVAYHQPVTRAEIEEIRGVIISKGTLDTLMEAGWIVPKGRKQTVGRPVTWVTTEAFLLHFGLAGLTDLPGIDELRAAGLIGPRPVSTLSETIGAPADERLPDVAGEGADEAEAAEMHEHDGGSDSAA
jgi:segregation and condensation protein B